MCSCSLRYISVLLFSPEDALCLLFEGRKGEGEDRKMGLERRGGEKEGGERERERERGGGEREYEHKGTASC